MIKSIVGGILIVFGALMLLGVSVNLSKSALEISDVVGAFLFGIGPIVGGGLLIRSRVKAKQQALQTLARDLYAQREKEIIRLAQARQGRVSIPDIVAATAMSSAEAEAMMREMTINGAVDMQVTDSGVIVYEFYEIAYRQPLAE